MRYTPWGFISDELIPEKRQSQDTLFTVGNGYFGIRGFFEEDFTPQVGNSGLYVAGVLGAGTYDAWEGRSRELCNIANVLRLRLFADGEAVLGTEKVFDFSRTLEMDTACYRRSYTWDNRLTVRLERFADLSNVHRIGQQMVLTAQKPTVLRLEVLLDSDVKNLNWESCEPLPVQPGRNHIKDRVLSGDHLITVLDDPDNTALHAAQQVFLTLNGQPLSTDTMTGETVCGRMVTVFLQPGDVLRMQKLVCVATDRDGDIIPADMVEAFLRESLSYEAVWEAHCRCWQQRWYLADVALDTDTDDQTALRYNIFELMCACPLHTDRLSIGARGLTGEMYEGCVFWDNEIFQLPFFSFTDPASAKRLLAFRYHTLEAAKRHARNNWFEGAMYPWQVSEQGIEQTPRGGGAFYAIHIVADIAYAIRQYLLISGDNDFLVEMGAELLLETARFWVSRVDYSLRDSHYHIRAVRGPNEYDVFVDDNAYTNCMAALNLRSAAEALETMQATAPDAYRVLCAKTGFEAAEAEKFRHIADHLHLEYDAEANLVAEDSTYFDRRPLDLKRAKPTAKRIIDSTMPYEVLPLYQVTKQSDTVTLMCLQPDVFSPDEQRAAYVYYEPRTAHDSSLSYAPYGWLAARLGLRDEAYAYFNRCAYLDIADIKLNTVSGLHFANFGGTWQVSVFGFGGVSIENGRLCIRPKLPAEWRGMTFRLQYRGATLTVTIDNGRVTVCGTGITEPLPVCLNDVDGVLDAVHPTMTREAIAE